MSAFADALVADAARRCGVETGYILSRHRQKFLVRERIAIARQLDARGYTSPQIGRVLHRDHSTILFYLGTRPIKPSTDRPAVWRAPKVEHVRWLVPRGSVPAVAVKSFRQPRAPKYLVPYAGADWREYVWRVRS